MDATRQSLVAGLVVTAALLGGVAVPAPVGATETAVAPVGDASGAVKEPGAGQTVDTVVITQAFGALPERPGRVRVTRRLDVPENVESLRTTLPKGAAVTGTSGGFARIGEREYEWAGGSRTPSISYTIAVNETGRVAGPEGTDGRYLFVDVGEWGLFRRPAAPVEATYRGSIAFERETAVDGPGAAGDRLVFVGEATETRRRAHGQTFRLVEPATADLVESREEVLASVTAASDALRVGDRDETVLMVAAPTSVDWAVEGLEVGDSDLYVTADERVDEATNVWIHEYVHTRQDVRVTPETEWTSEALATYYAALLTLEQERVDFEEFRAFLESGTGRYDSVVLSEPDTWTRGANYRKGALVAGALDRRLRVATDSGSDLQAVFRRLNERRDDVDAAELVSTVREVGTPEVAQTAERYTTTAATPSTWDFATHQAAFGPLPPRIRVALPADVDGANYRVSGPYRSRTLSAPPFVLVRNETLSVDLQVTNDGGRTGTYDVSYGLADGPLRSLTGPIDPGETVTETVDVRVDAVGDGPLRIGEYEVPVSIREPATARVDVLRANRSQVAPGGAVGIEIEVHNPADRPARRDLVVTVDGRTVATETVELDVGASRTVALPVRLEEAGAHRIAVGNASVTVHARGLWPPVGVGVEVIVALAALVVVAVTALVVLVRRYR